MLKGSRRRIVYAGYNFFSSCLAHLTDRDDVEVVLCLTGTQNESVGHIVSICERHGIPISFGRPNPATVSRIEWYEPDLLICAAYSYRLPVEALGGLCCINLHPSLLPNARGPNPLPDLLNNNSNVCGLSIHEMTPAFDVGPVLEQESIVLSPCTDIETLSLLMFAQAPQLLARVLSNFDDFWHHRTPQARGTYWPLNPDADRTIDASTCRAAAAVEIVRRFATLGVFVVTTNMGTLVSHSIRVAAIQHAFMPGSVVMDGGQVKYVALRDGMLLARFEMGG